MSLLWMAVHGAVSNRFELKFVLRDDVAARVEDELREWVRPDDVTGMVGYPVSSLYYDTRDLRCYWEKLDGIKQRRKVRIRHYAAGCVMASDPVFVEIKSRHDRVTSKKRVGLTLAEALALCDDWVEPAGLSGADRAHAGEVLGIVQLGPMQPAALTRYLRTAYRGTEADPALRITFDRCLRSSTTQLDLTERGELSALLPPQMVVLEAKVNERLPRWFADLVGRHGLQLVRLSKYARAIEVGWPATFPTVHLPKRNNES